MDEQDPNEHKRTFNTKRAEHFCRLVTYLAFLQEQGRAVFIDYSGHVDSFNVKVSKSPKEYEESIYDPGYPTLAIYSDNVTDSQYSDYIDGIIDDIKWSVEQQIQKESDLEVLEVLKAKYEPKKEEEVATNEG